MSRTAVSVALSLALHGAVGLVAIALLPGSGMLPDLVFDLTLTDEPEAAPAGSPSALSGPPRAAASGSPAPRAATSGPRAARAATITGAPARGVASSPRSVSEPPASTPAAHDLTRAPTEPPPRVPAAPSATPADNAPATAVAPSPDAIPVPDRAAGAPASPSTGGDRNASAPALGSESARVGSGGGVGPLSGGGGSETAAGSGTAARSGSAAGSTTGGGQTAAIGGGREDGGAEYAAYLTGLRQRIQASLRYPPAARRRGLEGTVHVEIVITAAGAVGPVAVVRSSSHALLDQAAVEAVRSLAPRPFPRDVPPRTLRVRLPVVFQLQ